MKLMFLSFFVVLIAFVVVKVSGEENDDKGLKEIKFRSGKVRQLWDKAKKMDLSSTTLADLFHDLKYHDHRFMELKQLKLEGGDEDGLIAGELQKKLSEIMMKYGLAAEKNIKQHEVLEEKKANFIFEDERLESLWKEIKTSGKFSSAELDKLLLEFKHQENKVVELKFLRDHANEFESASDNEIPQEEEAKNRIREELKDLQKDVENEYEKFQSMAQKRKDQTSLPFTEPRVLQLWSAIEKGNFTDAEKQSFLEELKHFERRIEKHRHFRRELEKSEEKIDFHHGGLKDAPPEKLNQHQKIQDKVYELSNKIQKTFASIRNRLGGVTKHNEL